VRESIHPMPFPSQTVFALHNLAIPGGR